MTVTIHDLASKCTTRELYADLCSECGSNAIAEEEAILQHCGREFLLPAAVAVVDGGEPTADYWLWLAEQTVEAQDEHDREIAAGHEWHQ